MSQFLSAALYSESLPGGAMWSMRIPRRRLIRLTALDPGANLSALLYNAHQPLDRLNLPDTLKALHTARLTRGHILMTDMGNSLVSIVEDSLGWHDPLCGHITASMVTSRFGKRTYQEFRNEFYRNARDNFLIELSKHGMGLADIVANVNFFSKAVVDDEGHIEFVPDHCLAGASIGLRTEMDILLVLANCPHPLSPAGEYPQARVEIEIFPCDPPGSDDFCRNFRPECDRSLTLTERLFL